MPEGGQVAFPLAVAVTNVELCDAFSAGFVIVAG
jgi:hypothetical protein